MRLGKHKILVKEGTLFEKIYGSTTIYERHRHRFEVNPEFIDILTANGLIFSAKSEDGIKMETLELPNHPCFIACQFHPEFQSRPAKPSPPYFQFIKSASQN